LGFLFFGEKGSWGNPSRPVLPCPRPTPSTMSQGNGVIPIAVMYGYYIRRFAVGQDRACPVPTGLTPGYCGVRTGVYPGYGWTSGVLVYGSNRNISRIARFGCTGERRYIWWMGVTSIEIMEIGIKQGNLTQIQ
jgi:hypothetical protein